MRAHLAIVATSLVAAVPALGQDGTFDPLAATRAFLTDTGPLGADSAEAGTITEADGTVTVENYQLAWSYAFQGEDDRTITMQTTLTIPSMTVTDLERTDEGYRAAEIDVPSAALAINVTNASVPLRYDVTLAGYTITDTSWAAFPAIEPNAAAPVSRFGPLLDWQATHSYERFAVEDVSFEVLTGDDRQSARYGPFAFGPVRDGQMDSFEYGPMTVTQEGTADPGTGMNEPVTVTANYGAVTGSGLDIRPLLTLFTGTRFDGADATMMDKMRIGRTTAQFGNVGSFAIESSVVDDVTVNLDNPGLLSRIDPVVVALLNGDEPDMLAVAGLALDAYGALGYGRYQIDNMALTFPNVEGSLGQILLENVSSDGFDRLAFSGGALSTPEGSGTLGLIEMTDLVLPAREDVLQAILVGMTGQPLPRAQALALIPAIGSMSVEGLDVVREDGRDVKLERASMALNDFVGTIPTVAELVVSGLVMPAELVPQPLAQALFEVAGINTLEADGNVNLRYDADTTRVELEQRLAVNGLGTLSTNAAASGIPEQVLTDPSRLQELTATAALSNLSLRLEDEGLTGALLTILSQPSGMSPGQFGSFVAEQVQAQLGAVTGDQAFANTVASAVRTFLSDPRTLSIRANPQNPVPFAQLAGAAITAPAALPQILGFEIEANR